MIRVLSIQLFALLFLLFLSGNIFAFNNEKRETQAVRTQNPPVIDGQLDEPVWLTAPVATGFFQYEPHNDRSASFETTVKVLFDDDALYIGANMIDPEPDKILTELGLRDSGDDINADLFWIDINPFDDGINGFRFQVSASGVQTDINISGTDGSRGGDENWDAVWLSDVTIHENGWTVEMKIPYSALRFPKNDAHSWGINFWREIRRSREKSSWNFVNRRVGDQLAYLGYLKGIDEITPPVRLALFPYVSSYLEKNGGGDRWGSSFTGGMDVKYGISNNFTMDMTLIPDFGQVQSDARVLNLTPYEVRYDEKRQFFTEGLELFGKAGIFYSRRIGSIPRGFSKPYQELDQDEIVTENPLETRLINATKISGRTSGGLGLGFFNSMTAPSHAIISDTITGNKRSITTQPFTNYNVFVADQSLSNNSFVSFINTNVTGSADGYIANVSATEFRFMDASNMFRFSGNAALSQQYYSGDEDIFGYKYDVTAGKVGGIWQYTYNRLVLSNRYEPNDLGFLTFNNLVMDKVNFSHNIFDPFWRLLNLRNELAINYNRLHTPDTFAGFNIAYNLRALFDTRFFLMFTANFRPLGNRDYYEPRVPDRFYETEKAFDFFLTFSTDYRKRVYMDGDLSYFRIMSDELQEEIGLELEPSFRASDKLNIALELEYLKRNGDIGFVGLGNEGIIFFGKRDTDTFINSLEASYIFTNHLSLEFDLRHYWSLVEYTDDYYRLRDDGRLDPVSYFSGADNINYNAFTIDMFLTWHFAPGSQLTFAWKNNIDSNIASITRRYAENLINVFEQPQINSFSIRLLYYLDYKRVRNIFS